MVKYCESALTAMLDAKPSLILKRHIKAAPAKVYTAWTDPEKITRWFGSDRGPTLHAETDLRAGGRFRIVFRMIDGEERAEVERMITRAADAAEVFVTGGIAPVMNQYNGGDPATTE